MKKFIQKFRQTKGQSSNTKTTQRNLASKLSAAARGNAESSWLSFPQSPVQTVAEHGLIILARARQAAIEYPFIERFKQSVADNVVGSSGFVLQSQAKNSDGTDDDVARDIIEKAYKDYLKSKNFTHDREMNGRLFYRLVSANIPIEGEVIIRKHIDADGISWSLIDPVLLEHNYIGEYKGNPVVNGIELNAENKRRVAYWIRKPSPPHRMNNSYHSTQRVRVPAEEIIHLWLPEQVGQYRGMSKLKSVLWDTRMLKLFKKHASENAATTAKNIATMTDEYGDWEEDTVIEHDGVEILNLGSATLNQHNPTFPSASVEGFNRVMQREIAMGLSVCAATMTGDMTGFNFSSSRSVISDEREVWKGYQEYLIEFLLKMQFEEWIDVALLTGELKGLSPSKIEEYKKAKFFGRRWPYINPIQDAKADKQKIENGTSIESEIIAESGRDPKDFFANKIAEFKLKKKLAGGDLELEEFLGVAPHNKGEGSPKLDE